MGQDDDQAGVRTTAVQALAQGFAQHPETFTLLWKRAEEDDDADVRTTAVQALAEGFAQHPETFTLLKRWAQSDPAEGVRRSSILGWAQNLKSLLSRQLLSRDLDGVQPGVDPYEVIDANRIADAATRLRPTPRRTSGRLRASSPRARLPAAVVLAGERGVRRSALASKSQLLIDSWAVVIWGGHVNDTGTRLCCLAKTCAKP